MIDLSSDTATRPTAGMRAFMAAAPVGDEQNREDPSVNQLQDLVAELTGKDAALFLPTGTMCNIIAFCVHCRRGDAVILDRWAHPAIAEAGGPAVHAGVMLRTVHAPRGRFTAEMIRPEITAGGTHTSRTSLVSIENTTNMGGGAVWPLASLAGVRALTDEHGMRLHMDGARLMNAVVASGTPARVFTAHADSVWIDLSKGLGCPVGAVLAGSHDFIEEARRFKHLFGGAMRQAGIVASAGIYAFTHHIDRLADDHRNAAFMADGLAAIPGIEPINGPVETNILFFDVAGTGLTGAEFQAGLMAHGIRMGAFGDGTIIRAVTHLDVSREQCEETVAAVREIVAFAR